MPDDRFSRLFIDMDRLHADLDTLVHIGSIAGTPGVNRTSYSDQDMAGRRWFKEACREAGLTSWMDGAGNVFGRWEAGAGDCVLSGSHLDTVPNGGRLDGALGACAALECIRTLKDAGFQPARPIEVVATADEEGRFGGMLGSQAICGQVDRDWLLAASDDNGLRLTEAMSLQGLDPEAVFGARRADIHAFVELHIEQGPVLERHGDDIGAVTGISGVFNWQVRFTGEANHSGTTPMDLRKDAFRGLARFVDRIDAVIAAHGTDQTRLTVGHVELWPNFPHTVPGSASFSIIGRDTSQTVMQAIADACRAELTAAADAHGLAWTVADKGWLAPMPCDDGVTGLIEAAAGVLGYRHRRMPSGAGHDAQTFAAIAPAGLIFIPSKGGVSHAPEEFTDKAAVARGGNVLLHVMRQLAVC